MNSLTLQWYNADQTKVQVTKIYEQQSSKNVGTFRIGRDPLRCDLVLTNPTVSGLHVEIFFDSQQQGFFIRNLRQSNPPVVDGKQLLENILPLFEGSIIYLGQQELKVTAVSITKVSSVPPTVLAPPPASPPPASNSQPVVPQKIKSQPKTQPIQHQHHHSGPNGANGETLYGLQCPKCGRVSSLEHLQVGCPWCGTSLAAALSVLVAPSDE